MDPRRALRAGFEFPSAVPVPARLAARVSRPTTIAATHTAENVIHGYLGLGELPDAPIVGYLARSLSAFYAFVSAITLFVSFDIRRYCSFVKLWAILVILIGFVLLGIDIEAGMPMSWTLCEGAPTIATGLIVLWLQRKIDVVSHDHIEP